MGREGEKDRERNIYQLPLTRPQLGTWPTTQACALTGNQTGDLLVHRLALNPLSHISLGTFGILINDVSWSGSPCVHLVWDSAAWTCMSFPAANYGSVLSLFFQIDFQFLALSLLLLALL